MKKIKIIFSSIISDAGEATRALEIADGIRKYCAEGYDADIIFLSNGSRFENEIIAKGFKIYKCKPQLSGIGYLQDFKVNEYNIIGDVNLAIELIKGEMEAFEELKPDVVIHGFYPIASVARRMMKKKIIGICYIPLPLRDGILDSPLIRDIPDAIKPLTYFPKPIRKVLLKVIPSSVKKKIPVFKQDNIVRALKEFNWIDEEPIENLFQMLKADLTIVNDFKEFHSDSVIPDNYKIVGPLYSPSSYGEMDKNILKVFSKDNKRLKIFCTLGSSGEKQYLVEALKALSTQKNELWSAVVLAPSSVCDINEVMQYANENIYITDKFVPAATVNSLADIVISHGGQGTLQTAIASGTPIVGYGMQMEQQINLDNIVHFGAGIRIIKHKWNAKNIQRAIKKIENDPLYRKNMNILRKSLERTNGKKNAAEEIWKAIDENYN